MKNIYYFFWISFVVKSFILFVLQYFLFDFSSLNDKNLILIAFFALFIGFEGAKFVSSKKFGRYFKICEWQFFFLLIAAGNLRNIAFAAMAVFVFLEMQLYLKEFCVISPGKKFDGNE